MYATAMKHATVVALAMMPAAASAETVLKLATSTPPAHVINENGTDLFMEKATEYSNGSITFEYYPAGQLGKLDQMLDLVKSGAADIVQLIGGNNDMPLLDMFGLPGLKIDSCVGGAAYREMAKEGGLIATTDYAKDDLKYLIISVSGPNEVTTRDQPIRGIEDFKGLKIRVGSSTVGATVSALGAVPVRLSGAETYESYSRGTVDGVVYPLFVMQNYQIDEISKFSTTNISWPSGTYLYVMNGAAWNKLPPEDQAALDKAAIDAEQALCDYTNKAVDDATQYLKDAGVELIEVPEEELAKISAAVEPVIDEWRATMEARGVPATQALEELRSHLGER